MSKYVFNDSIKDLKCHQNHENSPVILVQLQPEEQINKLLCVQCLETITQNFNTISIQSAIVQIKNSLEDKQKNNESKLKQRLELFKSLYIQICNMKQTVDELFSSLSQKVIEWKDQIKDVMKENIEISLQQYLERYNQKIDLKDIPNCQDNITQINSQFSQLIEIEIRKIGQIIESLEIKQILQDIKGDSELFPKSQKLLFEQNFDNTVQQITFNYDNSLLFVLEGKNFQSINLLNWWNEKIDFSYKHCFQKIVASRKKNQVVVYNDDSQLTIFYLKDQKWKNYNWFKINLGRIDFIGLDKDETQIILQNYGNFSIVKIDEGSQQLTYLNSIPFMSYVSNLQMHESLTKILGVCDSYIIICQQNSLKEWVLAKKISLPQDQRAQDAIFVEQDKILIKCNQNNSSCCFLYIQEQIEKIKNSFIFENLSVSKYDFSPHAFNRIKSLYLQRKENRYYFIKKTKDDNFIAWSQVIGTIGNDCPYVWSKDGKILAIWDTKLNKLRIYELIY